MSVRIEGIYKSFGPVPAVEDVSLELAANSFVSIVGPSGCGKSTLLRMVAGLVKPSSGSITVHDRPVKGPLRNVGMVFQSPVLLPWRTTLDNVLFVARMGGKRVSAHRDRANELIRSRGSPGSRAVIHTNCPAACSSVPPSAAPCCSARR